MIIKYNRAPIIRNDLNKLIKSEGLIDLTINDLGVSGQIPFNKRKGGSQLIELVKEGKVVKVIFEDIKECGGKNIKSLINTLEFFEKNKVLVRFDSIGVESQTKQGLENPNWALIISTLKSVHQMQRERIPQITEVTRKQQ